MGSRDKRIDAKIAKSAPFARPIMMHVRECVHQACSGVTETVKWSMPAFDFDGPMVQMGSFKAHCIVVFWKNSILKTVNPAWDPLLIAMRRVSSIDDLPPKKTLVAIIKAAAKLNASGTKVVKKKSVTKPVPPIPKDLKDALSAAPEAKATFAKMPPSHRREYIEWIVEAKQPATRARRLAQAITWIGEGKSRNWKYQ
jgi:uncharacterized protein YdeI (YjbR/CyaY-like superfamily)